MIGLKLKRLGFCFLILFLGFNPLTTCSQSASNLGRSGDPFQAFQAPFQKENLQTMAINVVTAGLMEKFGPPSTKALSAANKTPMFSDFVRYNAARSAFNTGLTMTITGKPLERAIKEGGVQFIGNTLGGYASYQIGQNYGSLNFDGTPKDSNLSYGEHKALHGVVGALTGGILNGSKSSKEIKEGVISGATGAMTAEMVGEYLIPIKDQAFIQKKTQDIVQEEIKKTGQMPSDERFGELFSKEVENCKDLAQIIGASTGAFIGKDANTAYWTSQNAVDNNMGAISLGATVLGKAIQHRHAIAKALKECSPGIKELVTEGKISVKTLLNFSKKSNEKADQLAKQEAGKQVPSTTGGPGLEPEKDPKKEGEKKIEKPFSKNPKENPELFERIYKTSAKRNKDDGSIWEKDTSSHGGAQWKRWPNQKSWERGDKPNSIWPEGGVRK